jgi:hypothetical protein
MCSNTISPVLLDIVFKVASLWPEHSRQIFDHFFLSNLVTLISPFDHSLSGNKANQCWLSFVVGAIENFSYGSQFRQFLVERKLIYALFIRLVESLLI